MVEVPPVYHSKVYPAGSLAVFPSGSISILPLAKLMLSQLSESVIALFAPERSGSVVKSAMSKVTGNDSQPDVLFTAMTL